MRCWRYKHHMPPHLANQNVDVPTKQAYLNLELTPFSLCGNGIGLPLSLFAIGPFLKQATW